MPNVSTHFQFLKHAGNNPADLTIGKVYKIKRWEGFVFTFLDDVGDERHWTESTATGQDARMYTSSGKVGGVFEINLEKILK